MSPFLCRAARCERGLFFAWKVCPLVLANARVLGGAVLTGVSPSSALNNKNRGGCVDEPVRDFFFFPSCLNRNLPPNAADCGGPLPLQEPFVFQGRFQGSRMKVGDSC